MNGKMLGIALRYLIKYKWAVFPCKSDKTPLVKWEPYQEQFPTENEIKQWWGQYPNANIAIITGKISGLTVIDVDSEAGDEALWELLPEGFDTLQAKTVSGGLHYYCKYAKGTRNAARWITDCDVRSEGGYVVAPPSMGENGGWAWIGSPEDPIASVPELVLKKLTREVSPIQEPAAPPLRDLSFTKGTRDEDIYHVADCLVKGGMPEEEIRVIATILANQCKPPFLIKDAMRKVQSALSRQGRKHGDIIGLIREWVEGQAGTFATDKMFFDLGFVDSQTKKSARNALTRMAKAGELNKTAWADKFRIPDRDLDPIDFMKASDGEIPFKWPLGVGQHYRLLPKTVSVLAGEQNAGKTAFLLALSGMNLKEHEIHYFSSEMGPEEFKKRLQEFQPEIPLKEWTKHNFFPHERDSNFADVIKPDAINIVDYLEVDGSEGREFWRVGGMLKDIRDRLNKGVAIVALQKNPDTKKKESHNLGLGGYRGMEKPRLYMSMTKYPHFLRLEKVKIWRGDENPDGLIRGFKLVRGCRFHPTGEWYRRYDAQKM